MQVLNAIEEIQEHNESVKSGKGKVAPGQLLKFSDACTENDTIWQGDLAIVISKNKEAGFIRLDNPTAQLVPGNNIGAKHCMDTTNVVMYVPSDWSEESLIGPWVKPNVELKIEHPVHGDVVIPAGMSFQCYYQKEWSKEEQKERRARD